MNTLIRYSSCNDIKILYSDGKVSVLPKRHAFSLEMDTGFVTTDLPFSVLKHLRELPYAFLTDSIHYNDAFETLNDDLKKYDSTDIHTNISLNARLCNMLFSNGNSTFFSQSIGRMAACKQGIVILVFTKNAISAISEKKWVLFASPFWGQQNHFIRGSISKKYFNCSIRKIYSITIFHSYYFTNLGWSAGKFSKLTTCECSSVIIIVNYTVCYQHIYRLLFLLI